jgi:hypothetical protein
MQKFYNLFYIINSFKTSSENEEILIDFQAFKEMDEILNGLLEVEPSDEVLEKIFKFV